MIDILLSVFAPHLCSGCGKIGTTFCNRCKYDIKEMPFLGCLLCGSASKAGICTNHEVAYNQAWIIGERQGNLQRLIGGLKFQNMKTAARSLAELLNERLPLLPLGTMIVPIPTAPAHVRERGYDHMLLVARNFARLRGLPLSQVVGRNTMATQHHAN
jgi:predicted amidophosphoribosyltransferase